MRLSDLTTGQPFKVGLRVWAVFLVTYALAGWLLVAMVTRGLEETIAGQAASESLLLSEIYQHEGQQGLETTLRDMQRHYVVPGRIAGLFDASGISLIGPLSVAPDFVGVVRRNVYSLTNGEINGQFFLKATHLDQLKLVVGRDAHPLTITRNRLIGGLVVFGIMLTMAMLALGLWASYISFKRLGAMERALRAVAGGNLEARLPVTTQNDQFDRVTVQVNRNLDRLSQLMRGFKSAALAIAHDLKTPLLHAQIAMDQAADACGAGEDPLPRIEEALAAVATLNAVFETVLRISRIQANPDQSRFAQVSLPDIIAKVAEFMAPLAAENAQTIDIQASGDVNIHGDVGMVQQALVNLVSNAIRYAGPKTTITLSAEHRPRGTVLQVRDTGPGVPPEKLSELSQPFVRGDTARSTKGSGLGLTLVQAIANHHEAQLQIDNANPGLRVALVFPKL